MIYLFLSPQVFSRALPMLLVPMGVLIANYGWTPPDSIYVGDLATWVIFAFLLGIAMWNQDRINQSYSSHWMFLPIVGMYNGFTFGLAMVLVLAGSTTPNGAIVLFFIFGIPWGVFVAQKVSLNSDREPLDDTKLKPTLLHLIAAIGCFILTVSGLLDVGIGGALGFQFLVLLPIHQSMDLDPKEESLRRGLYFAGGILLIGYSFVT
ncbi:MAG: hypothetical protein JXQ85_02675 [Cognatishimia sp.]|uniref:hypothetical protein n=1 Tax=Cognatishimia sp. TaxID=2211648 RepID=UPI003B8D7146